MAPNLGASFAGGGGSSVAANIAQIMLEEHFHVSLAALSGYPKSILDDLHRTSFASYGNRLSTFFLFKRRFENRGAYKAASSMAISPMLFCFHYLLTNKIRKIKPDIVWFNDDVPRLCEERLKDQYSVQYVNFAFQSRLKVRVDEQWETYDEEGNSIVERRGYIPQMVQMLVGENALACDQVIANSSVTSRYIKTTNPRVTPLTIYPPVRIAKFCLPKKKSNQIVAIGAFRPNKRFGDIIRALALSRQPNSRLIISGLLDNDDYLEYLRRLAKKLDLQNRVALFPNATNDFIEKTLSESSMIVSAARFEPFGISVVEGMGYGCIPVVFAGEDSGPWVDITQNGRYGFGFRNIHELSSILENVSGGVEEAVREELKDRASQFNNIVFKERIKTCFQDELT